MQKLSLFTIFLIFFFTMLSTTEVFAQDYDDFDIVILHSYEKGNVWTDKIDRTFKEKLQTSGKSVVFYSEYMDAKRFFGDEYDHKLKEVYSAKYRNKLIDLIVVSDDYAFDFAIKYRKSIFNDAPIIFSGMNGYNKEKRRLYKEDGRFTGVVETFDIIPTLKLTLASHPNAKKIYVINTIFTPSGRYLKRQFVKAFEMVKPTQEIVYIEDMYIQDVYNAASTFEADSIVLFGAYARDKSGNYFKFTENMSKLSQYSTRPIYGFLGFYMGHGLTGGYLTNGVIHGTEIARMASEYLAGKQISEIPLIDKSINELVFDYNKLVQYNIDISTLPRNSKIIRTSSQLLKLYDEYKIELLILFIFFVFLILSFFVLLYFFEQQKKFKATLIKANELLEARVSERTIQLVQQQSKLVNSARFASIGEMASGIAHEINNPLAIIDLSSNRIEQRSSDPELKIFTDRISQTITRITKIIKGLKHLAKDGEKSKMLNFNIREAVEDVTSLCLEKFREHNINITIDVDAKLMAYGSISQIAQVILNLLNNSFDELVNFNLQRWVKLEAQATQVDGSDYIEISVTDSGKGIGPEDRENIFKPFFTTKLKRRGTGLGLSICRNIIERHKGQFFLDEKSPHTRFVILLPIDNSHDNS